MIAPHIDSGTTERTASLIWPIWTFITTHLGFCNLWQFMAGNGC